jgi:exosortase K
VQSVRENRYWQILLWWLAVLAVVVLLKRHYSIATAADLEWMLRPLSQLLEWFSGYHFYRDSNYEWVSESADVRLVKACAGINFMLMSLMGYAWIFRPRPRSDIDPLSWIVKRMLLLCAAITAAWTTCLLANSLRILVAMTVNTSAWGLDVIGIDAAQLHRLIGMGIYVPLLSVQMVLGNRSDRRDALAGPALLYLMMMVVVPLLTGNALVHPALFVEHLGYVSVMIAVMCGIYFLCCDRLRNVDRGCVI